MAFLSVSSQIFVISQAEARLPLQLEDAVRPEGEGEEVRMDGWMRRYEKRASPKIPKPSHAIFSTVATNVTYW